MLYLSIYLSIYLYLYLYLHIYIYIYNIQFQIFANVLIYFDIFYAAICLSLERDIWIWRNPWGMCSSIVGLKVLHYMK